MILSLVVKKTLEILLLVFKIFCIAFVSLLVLYSAAFSIGGTIAIYKAYKYVTTPLKEVVAYQNTNPGHTNFMIACKESLQEDSLTPDTLMHIYVPLDSISTNLVEAVLAAEDDGFYLHPGFDIASVLAAAEYNKSAGKNKHGASTITQQMAKNLFLSEERTFERKIKELVYAVLMEKYLGKERILELYLNYAQWGKNIFGCEAAAQHYYGKSARKLSRLEAARLAAVLAKPGKLSPHYTKSVFMGKRIAVIAQNLYQHHTIGDAEYFHLTGTVPVSKRQKDTTAADDTGIKDTSNISKRTSF